MRVPHCHEAEQAGSSRLGKPENHLCLLTVIRYHETSPVQPLIHFNNLTTDVSFLEDITKPDNYVNMSPSNDKSAPYMPVAGLARDGYSRDGEATATCYCGAVQLAFVSKHHPSTILVSASS